MRLWIIGARTQWRVVAGLIFVLARPRSGGRLQLTAQAVGERPRIMLAPEARKRMSHTSGNILLHFIFSTDGRRPSIKPEFRDDLFAYLGGIIREMNGTALIINGASDHVHMLTRARPAHSAAEIVRVVKANSSRWVREKHSATFGWQTGYGVFSVSESSVPEVTKYIAGQEEHHKKQTFQEEYVAFLKKNHIEYDPKYVWD